MTRTDGSIAHESFLIVHHCVNCKFFTVLTSDDGDCGLLCLNDFGHLFDDFNFIFVLYYASKRFIIAHRLYFAI